MSLPNIDSSLLSQPSLSLLDCLRDIAILSFQEGHCKPPYPWQTAEIVHILQMKASPTDHPPGPVLLVHSTGGSKSAVRNTIGFALGGIILTIVPLLSLGADQCTKLKALATAHGLPIKCFHLDEYHSRSVNLALCCMLQSLPDDTNETIFLFSSSPQKITESSEWTSTISSLVDKPFSFFLCIDECHLYAQFGLEFQLEFAKFKDAILQAIVSKQAPVPILCLTATATKQTVKDFEALTALTFCKPDNLHWPSSSQGVSRIRL